ncbi:hypothetical protein Hdeb2414_s0002g00063191 [Helianthus debilis subsp. tardiflorus]
MCQAILYSFSYFMQVRTMNVNTYTLLIFLFYAGLDTECKYVILGEKGKAQLIRESKKDIELIMTELQKNFLNYTQYYSSQSKDEYDDGPNTLSGDLQEDVTIPLSKLNLGEDVNGADKVATATSTQDWISELSKIHVWHVRSSYATELRSTVRSMKLSKMS